MKDAIGTIMPDVQLLMIFGMAGGRDFERHSKYVEHWHKIEEAGSVDTKYQSFK